MSGFGYRGWITDNHGKILYDAGSCCIAYFHSEALTTVTLKYWYRYGNGPYDTRAEWVRLDSEEEGRRLAASPELAMEAVLKHAQEKSLLKNRTVTPDMLSDCDISPAGLKSTCDSFDGAQTQVLAAKPKYVIVKACWSAEDKYWLVSDYYPVSSFDSTPVWSVDLTKRQVDDMIAHPEKILPYYSDMRAKYPQGQ